MAYPGTLQIDYATPYETGTTQLYPIGQKAETPDGCIFRYTEMGGTVGIASNLYQSAALVAHHNTQAVTVALAVGDTEISFHDGGTALAVNEMAGGTLVLEETSDLGHIYRVKSNTVTAANETICQLEDGVTVQKEMAVAANNVLTFIKNSWKDVIVSPASANSGGCAGIPRVIIAADAYGWVQTRGPASCAIDSGATAILVGNTIRASETHAGFVALYEETAGIVDYQIVGWAMDTAPDDDFGTVFLTIE